MTAKPEAKSAAVYRGVLFARLKNMSLKKDMSKHLGMETRPKAGGYVAENISENALQMYLFVSLANLF